MQHRSRAASIGNECAIIGEKEGAPYRKKGITTVLDESRENDESARNRTADGTNGDIEVDFKARNELVRR